MIRIKSLRPCKLVITDAGLKLSPGQVVAVNSLSPQTENLIAMGYIARMDEGQVPDSVVAVVQNQTAENIVAGGEAAAIPKEYENLHVPEAIEFVSKATDSQVLRAILKEEKRKTVIDTINKRLGELEK